MPWHFLKMIHKDQNRMLNAKCYEVNKSFLHLVSISRVVYNAAMRCSILVSRKLLMFGWGYNVLMAPWCITEKWWAKSTPARRRPWGPMKVLEMTMTMLSFSAASGPRSWLSMWRALEGPRMTLSWTVSRTFSRWSPLALHGIETTSEFCWHFDQVEDFENLVLTAQGVRGKLQV